MRCNHSTLIPPGLENKTQCFFDGSLYMLLWYFCISQENPNCLSMLAAAHVMSCSPERINALSFLRACSLLSGNLNLSLGFKVEGKKKDKLRLKDSRPAWCRRCRMKCANGLLVCLAESQMLCACVYVRATKQGVPEVLCWPCASISAKVSTELYSVLEISVWNKGRKPHEGN